MLEKWRLKIKTKIKLNAQQDMPKISVMDGVLPIMVLNDMTFTCKKCGMSFEDKKHYEIHKGVHKKVKSKVKEYGTDMPWRPGL